MIRTCSEIARAAEPVAAPHRLADLDPPPGGLHVAVQRTLPRISAGEREGQRQPAFGVGVHGPGVAHRTQRIGPAPPHSGALLHQCGVDPVRNPLEILDQRPQGFWSIRHGLDAVPLRLLDQCAGFRRAEFTVVGLGDEPLGDGVALGQSRLECRRDPVGGKQIDAGHPAHPVTQPRVRRAGPGPPGTGRPWEPAES